MLLVVVAALALAGGAAAAPANMSIGTTLGRTYTRYNGLPMTAAAAAGEQWQNSSACTAGLGWAFYYQSSSGSSEDYPITLYYADSGAVSGMAIDVWGELPAELVEAGHWRVRTAAASSSSSSSSSSLPRHFLTVGFRDASMSCGGGGAAAPAAGAAPIGDRIVVNADSKHAMALPLTLAAAHAAKFTPGSCIDTMGTHYFLDLATAPAMSWYAKNLFPVVPMYSNGTINAFFFASPAVQQDWFNAHWWEPVALPNALMCYNWCSNDCTFHDTSRWSTMHIYLNNYNSAKCGGGCSTACCPGEFNRLTMV